MKFLRVLSLCLWPVMLSAQSVKQVTVACPSPTLALGARMTCTPIVRLANGRYSTTKTIEWASSNPNVAIVSAKGVVSTIRAGSVTIGASTGGAKGEAALTVTSTDTATAPPPPVAVASVTVSFGASSLIVGQTTNATAVVRDSAGDVLTNRQVIWSTLTPSFASVSPSSGLVTGIAAGTASIRATVESKVADGALVIRAAPVDTATTPVDTSPAFSGYANEPAGFSPLSPILTGDTVPSDVNNATGWIQRTGSLQQVLDTVPGRGALNVLQITFPAGMLGGSAPGMVWTASSTNPQNWPAHPHQIYQSWWYRLSPNYPINLVANKVHYSNIGGQNQVAIEVNGNADYPMGPGGVGAVLSPNQATQFTAAIFPAICLQGGVGIDGVSNNGRCLNINAGVASGNPVDLPDSVQIKRGRWYHFETLYIANTAGHWDGGAVLWLNGQMLVDYRNRLKWTETGEYWQWTSWTPVYGGGGSIPSGIPNAFHHLRDFYVSGKP